MSNVALQSAGGAVIAATSVDPAHGPENIISGYVPCGRLSVPRSRGAKEGESEDGAQTAGREHGAAGPQCVIAVS
jgi:hypothetical protein